MLFGRRSSSLPVSQSLSMLLKKISPTQQKQAYTLTDNEIIDVGLHSSCCPWLVICAIFSTSSKTWHKVGSMHNVFATPSEDQATGIVIE